MVVMGPFGNGTFFLDPPSMDKSVTLVECRLGLFSKSVWDLYHDMKIVLDMAQQLEKGGQRGLQCLRALNKAINIIVCAVDHF